MSNEWWVLSRREVFAAPPWVRVSVEEVRLPSGRVVRDFYQVVLPDFAIIVAQTTDSEIVSLRQYKHGVGRVSTMLPAGLIEPGEEPLTCARRELLEETGYTASDWRSLGTYVVDGNRGCGRAHVFAALGARRTADPKVDELEPLAVHLSRPADVVQAVVNGEMVALAHAAAMMLSVGAGLIRM